MKRGEIARKVQSSSIASGPVFRGEIKTPIVRPKPDVGVGNWNRDRGRSQNDYAGLGTNRGEEQPSLRKQVDLLLEIMFVIYTKPYL